MKTEIGKQVDRAVALLSAGELVSIPTETVYGLAANALNPTAVFNIFKVKKRPTFDPLIVHIPKVDVLDFYAHSVPRLAYDLAMAFWPGPLTLILPRKSIIPDLVSSGLDTVGLRQPSHPLTLELLNQLDFPLAAPSANPFGYISPTSAQHVFDQLQELLPYILDGGPCRVGVESTIVGFEGDEVFIYRLGGLTLEEIRKIAPHCQLKLNTSSNPVAPGMLKSHYAPQHPFHIGDIRKLLVLFAGKRIGVLSLEKNYSDNEDVKVNEILSKNGNLDEAAVKLFSAMRVLDASSIDVIIGELVPDEGMGRAINDRLNRAAF
jgi:L-threonylcarbamoyladenylate synthase